MNEILLNISITAIITAIFKLLIPDERNAKQIKLLLSCFFIVTVMNVLNSNVQINGITDIFAIDTSYNDYSIAFEKQTAEETAENLRKYIRNELVKENIEPEKIYIDINISENSSISFNEIRLVFDDISTDEAERAVSITEKCVGNEIKVSLEGA